MADREEKLAAGLKKLKQFQQRSVKKVIKRKLFDSPSNNTVTSLSGTEVQLSQKVLKEVPSTEQKCSSDLEQSKTLSNSCTDLTELECASKQSVVSSPEGSFLSDLAVKSKSDQDLTIVNELSSTESLRQISLQVNGLMSETNAFINGDVEIESSVDLECHSLEKRNNELAQMANSLRQSNDQLQFQLLEQKGKNKQLSLQFEKEKKELLEKSHKEQVSLKDQLQVHIQTIGILVAEKTELQSSLSLSQQTAKQKAGEAEELQGRLRASRQRASDLERELISLNNSNQQLEKIKVDSNKEVERLKLDNYKFSKVIEDLKLANGELSEKLNEKMNSLQQVEKKLLEYDNKLSASELKLHPSTLGSSHSEHLEEAYAQNFELEKRLSLQKESVDKLINERDQMSEQYQQYIQQLSEQVTSLRDEIMQLGCEKEDVVKENNVLKEKLEAPSKLNENMNQGDSVELKLKINILENQKQELKDSLEFETSKSSKMEEHLKGNEEKITELEKHITRLKDDQVDKYSLVEAMQSDKIAASRAVTQNRELKIQLEELQNAFVTMSNDKLGLAEKLHSEQHITKELGERLAQQEEELQELRDQVFEKETELQNLHKSNRKGIYQQNQIADRMRHYEAQGQLVEMLQNELHQAQEQINELTILNSDLRMAVATQVEVTVTDEFQKEDKDASKRSDLVASLSASVRQLEMERNQLMRQLEEQKQNRSNLEKQMKKKEIQFHKDVNESNDVISREEYMMMKNSMVQLEERFKQTMNRIADLTDERQQLEHLVMQLQGETDTIGDYIALYQIQRSLMHKRASEKDEYIAQLARDREGLKTKLGELQSLVMRLLNERKLFQAKSIEMANDLDFHNVCSVEFSPCDEHDAEVFNGNTGEGEEPETVTKHATARKIMDLLTEIESTNLVEKPVLDSFHPCPVCSGRLITV